MAASPDAFIAMSYPPDTFMLPEQCKIVGFNPQIMYLAIGGVFPGLKGKYGNNVNGTQRRLRNGATSNYIDYNVTDSSGTAWPSAGLSFTGTGADVALGLRGVVPVQSAKPAGAYADQLTITVTY